MPQHEHLARLVFELFGHVLADPRLLAAAVTYPFRRGDVMGDVLAGQMVGDGATTVSLFPLARRRFLIRRGRGWLIGCGRRCIVVEEMLLPGRFRQPLTARPEEHPLQCEVFFLEARVGTLHFLGRRHELVELPLEIVESEPKGAEQLLAGRQVVRDGFELLSHNHIYD
ncbi:MAG TPA: hypothetical protein VHX68_20925 [Planctomycetaceae bacterium]|nr:hypothetical protein [Planctomycetaceae bacterium]